MPVSGFVCVYPAFITNYCWLLARAPRTKTTIRSTCRHLACHPQGQVGTFDDTGPHTYIHGTEILHIHAYTCGDDRHQGCSASVNPLSLYAHSHTCAHVCTRAYTCGDDAITGIMSAISHYIYFFIFIIYFFQASGKWWICLPSLLIPHCH